MITRNLIVRLALCSFIVLCPIEGSAQPNTREIVARIAALKDGDPAVRWASALALSKFGSEAVPPLITSLRDCDENARAYAAIALGKIGAAAKITVPNLVAALKDSSDIVRENAANAIGDIGPDAGEAVEALIVALSDRDPFVNGKSAEALSRIGSAAVPGLIRTLKDGNPNARWCATIALVKMGPDASPAVQSLTNALTDSSDNVRWGSTVALGNIGPKARSAVPAIIGALSDRDQDVRDGASVALDRIDPTAMETPPDWRSIAATIDTLVPWLMRETHVPGVAIALLSKRNLAWSAQYGVTSISNGRPVTEDAMFEACSMSKPVFACLVMKLVELRKLDLDRPLVEYLDPSSLRGQPLHDRITARMVLSHTSGLPNWRKGEEESDGPLPVMFEPGSKFGYSGEGMYYLQQVVERVTGKPLDILAEGMLFRPLGLRHTSFVWTEGLDSLIAAGHDSAGGFLRKTRYVHPNAAYTLYISASDYARFLLEIINRDPSAHDILGRQSIDTMLSHQVRVDSREPIERPGRARGSAVYWGLGWSINSTSRGDIFHHSGANRSGFRCFSQFDPAAGSGIVIMCNGLGGTDLWTRLINRIGNL